MNKLLLFFYLITSSVFGQVGIGGNGGTHRSWFNGTDLNDLILLEREIQNTKAFQTFIEERGEVELINSYLSSRIHRFN